MIMQRSLKVLEEQREKELKKGNGQFVKLFEKLRYRHGAWQAWHDMVHLFAIEIANSVDYVHAPGRREMYDSIIGKYADEEKELMAQLFAEMVRQLEANPHQDFLGQTYMELRLGNDGSGQVFTPYHISELMARMNLMSGVKEEIEKKGYVSICDPTCGGGAMLIAGAHVMSEVDPDWKAHTFFVGQDIDSTVAMMAYVQLSLIGCAGYIRIGNTLEDPPTGGLLGDKSEKTWYLPATMMNLVWVQRIYEIESA